MRTITFKFAAQKARAAIQWMLEQQHRLDLHTILKTCYFADKEHLNAHYRPVFGASYRAMRFGPVPLEIYEMLKGDNLWLAELGEDRYPWKLDGHDVRLEENAPPDMQYLSETDMEALTAAFSKSISMTFTERTKATHGPDWQKAELGMMRYEDMIEDSDLRLTLVPFLQENARFMRL